MPHLPTRLPKLMALVASAALATLLLWRLWLQRLWQRPCRDPRAATAVPVDQLAAKHAVLFAVGFRNGARRSRGRRPAWFV